MKFNAFFKAVFLLTTFGLIVSCDKDFNEIGADLIDDIHYDFDKAEFSALAYNVATGSVQTNNLPINSLGYYKNGVFGETTASFLTQVELASVDPEFFGRFDSNGNPDSRFKIDSVYLYVPYFSDLESTDATSGDSTYSLDSIHGEDNKLKLSVYRSQYFLRNLDPENELLEQRYYSNQVSVMSSTIATDRLNDATDLSQNDEFKFTNDQIKILKNNNPIGSGTVKERLVPGIFLNLNKQKFYDAIFSSAATGKLVDNNVFKDYFKGLYFKTEGINQKNALARLNFALGKITIVYHGKDSETATEYERKTVIMNLAGNSVNFFENVNSTQYTNALTNPDVINGQSKLYLKGGEGSMAVIKIFGPDSDADGVADELESIKTNGWLINEANLVFTIDNATMDGVYDSSEPNTNVEFEPNRVMLYDLNNKRILIDYSFDNTTNSLLPKYNKYVHDGIIKKTESNKGIQYKVRLTNHIRNLVTKDSTNVNLGLVVTESINNVNNVKLFNSFTAFGKEVKYIPAMSVASPLGTILWGNNIPLSDPNYEKRLKLEIFYTKPD